MALAGVAVLMDFRMEGGLFMTAEVVFAAMFGVLFFSDEISWCLWVGGLLIFSNAVAFKLKNRRGF